MEMRKKIRAGEETFNLTCEETINKYMTLAKGTASKYHYSNPRLEYDDLVQICMIAIWKAYDSYSIEYSFTSWVIKYMQWQISRYIHDMSKFLLEQETTTRLDEPIVNNKDGSEKAISELIGEEDQDLLNFELTETMKNMLALMTERQRDEILSCIAGDESKSDMAKKYNVSKQTFANRAEKTMNRFRMLFIKSEVA